MISVTTFSGDPQSDIDFSFWENNHNALFNAKIPYAFGFFVIDPEISLSTSF
jgi:hypothetical protein